ncbi:serine hydrolase FSH [Neofusicoccum parvum]|uniref:Serine hydrolase FSH n=1 Tax=Neofusicoccum parvum TaxID=310453 RepID=A0ACB5SPK9_9PEZI|nr:serine hydrolase FSH [Neofusicoccum parvum]
MVVRILCLHGMGVNAAIYASQTATLRLMLPSDYEFDFLPAAEACEPAAGVAAFFPGPYRCWYSTPTTAAIDAAHTFILKHVQRAGPFDGVIGFSQGAALAASILLRQELAGERPPFKFAVLFGAPLPFTHTTQHGIDLRRAFGASATVPTTSTSIPTHLAAGPDGPAAVDAFEPARADAFYQMYHASVDEVRIRVPTVHVIGARDQWRRHSLDLIELCAKEVAFVLEHDGGHEIPRRGAEDVCDLIETAAAVASAGPVVDTGLVGKL